MTEALYSIPKYLDGRRSSKPLTDQVKNHLAGLHLKRRCCRSENCDFSDLSRERHVTAVNDSLQQDIVAFHQQEPSAQKSLLRQWRGDNEEGLLKIKLQEDGGVLSVCKVAFQRMFGLSSELFTARAGDEPLPATVTMETAAESATPEKAETAEVIDLDGLVKQDSTKLAALTTVAAKVITPLPNSHIGKDPFDLSFNSPYEKKHNIEDDHNLFDKLDKYLISEDELEEETHDDGKKALQDYYCTYEIYHLSLYHNSCILISILPFVFH